MYKTGLLTIDKICKPILIRKATMLEKIMYIFFYITCLTNVIE